jgi:hypothetical protein
VSCIWPTAAASSGRQPTQRGRLKGQDGRCRPAQPTFKNRLRQPGYAARRACLRCGHRAAGAGVGVAPAGSLLTALRQGLNHDDEGTEGVAPGKVEEGGGALTR